MASIHRIVRFAEVLARTGRSRATIYRKVAQGTFPQPLKVNDRAIGWASAAFEDWLANPR